MKNEDHFRDGGGRPPTGKTETAAEPPKFAVEGGTLSPVEARILVSPERALRSGYDDARGVVNLEDPAMQIICCSIAVPTHAPAGMHAINHAKKACDTCHKH